MPKKFKQWNNDEHEAALERRRVKMYEKQKYKKNYYDEGEEETTETTTNERVIELINKAMSDNPLPEHKEN